MFYSQFILAKKGPLGTIWIAAHLERKLRKNQVADTDIGVSVDSILFPEVPIALRLSSHLLLGVVRIYSRKVNYLFHDCSEALLHIKQAFRSTAVDLPLEESTAPYHSITLPETFDLDDFELPDSASHHDNFVDHHVSAREQITLQDNMEGTAYSTSQFGPDERFGDGDASQIGLDLDEELCMAKGLSPHHASALLGSENVELEISAQPATPFTNMDNDDLPNEDGEVGCAVTPKNMPEPFTGDLGTPVLSNSQVLKKDEGSSHLHGYNIQTPDLNEMIFPCEDIEDPPVVLDGVAVSWPANKVPPGDSSEHAQAPSTLGLMEEKIPDNVQEVPALCPQRRTSPFNDVETIIPGTFCNSHLESECRDSTIENGKIPSVSANPEFPEIRRAVLTEPKPVVPSLQCSDGFLTAPIEVLPECGQKNSEVLQNGFLCDRVKSLPAFDQTYSVVEIGATQEVLLDSLMSSSCSIETSILKTTGDKSLSDAENAIVNSNLLGSDVSSDVLKDKCETQALSNHDSVGDVESCLDTHVLPLNSDCSLRPCCSQLYQANVSSLEDGLLAESTPALLLKEGDLCPSDRLVREEELLAYGSSVEVQGEGFRSANFSEKDMEVHQNSGYVPSENKADCNKPDELLPDTQLKTFNCTASSEYPEREMMLLPPARGPDLPIDIGQYTAEKGTTESDGSVDRPQSLCGQKRHFMESTPVLQNGSTAKLYGVPRSKRKIDNIPDDDDLLASILVGRTPVLKIKPTPPLPIVATSKRPRVTPGVGALKRKVLLDDTMVLHADAIRKQLINIEDIRRIRKKAPCTRTEIWMIQKCLLEAKIFCEPVFTGITAELTVLHSRMYDLNDTLDSQIDANHSCLEVPKAKLPRSSKIVGETSVEGMGNPIATIPDQNDGEKGDPSAFLSIETQQCKPHSLGCDDEEETEVLPDAPQPNSSSNYQLDIQDKGDDGMVNKIVDCGAHVPIVSVPHSGNEYDASVESRTEPSFINKNNETEASPQMNDKLCLCPEQSFREPVQPSGELGEMNDSTLHCIENLASVDNATNDMIDHTVEVAFAENDMLVHSDGSCMVKEAFIVQETRSGISVEEAPQDCHANVSEIVNEEMLVSMLDNCTGVGADMLSDSPAVVRNANPSISDVAVESGCPIDPATVHDQAMEEIGKDMLEAAIKGEVVRVLDDEGNRTPEIISAEGLLLASSCPLQLNADTENVSSAVGENSGFQESNLESVVDVESIPAAAAAAAGRDSSDFCSAICGNDTEFLNVDDDIDAEEVDNDVPNSEEAQSLEKSEWSSRTRGVARYLKSLFDDESGRGRKIVYMDRLLTGKTRKEASRMFFETLVLKSRDYIHVEQENSFENINIKPRAMILKSDF